MLIAGLPFPAAQRQRYRSFIASVAAWTRLSAWTITPCLVGTPEPLGASNLHPSFRPSTIQELHMKVSAIITLAGSLMLAAAGASAADESAQGLNDAQIAAIVVVANQVDIDAGKLAKSKSSNPDVKEFAQLMITDHSGVNKQATNLVNKLHVTPQENPTSRSLKKSGERTIAKLKGLKGTAFDKAYITHEVAYHKQVIDAVNNTLIPNAQNKELKALLIKVRPALVAHLEHAKRLQASLTQKS
jgi:putative membrane protein